MNYSIKKKRECIAEVAVEVLDILTELEECQRTAFQDRISRSNYLADALGILEKMGVLSYRLNKTGKRGRPSKFYFMVEKPSLSDIKAFMQNGKPAEKDDTHSVAMAQLKASVSGRA